MLNKQQIQKALQLLCSPDEAKRVGWEVVGMRAALLSHAFLAHFVLRSREDAQTALKLTDAQWIKYGNHILAFWQESEASGQLTIAPPKAAPKAKPRKGPVDSFAASKFGNALALPVMQDGPIKVPELPGEAAARTDAEQFEMFWTAFPNKTNRTYAETCFRRLKPTPELMLTMIDDLKLRRYTRSWTEQGGKFVGHPSTYLNNKKWEEPIILNQMELAISVLSKPERSAMFGKTHRELESWLGSQQLLGQVPTQEQLEEHLKLRRRTALQDTDNTVIDIEVSASPSVAARPPISAPATTSGAVSVPTVPAPRQPQVLDPFETEFMQAVDCVQDPQKRDRIMSKDMKAKREWLLAFKAVRGSAVSNASVQPRASRVVSGSPDVSPPPLRPQTSSPRAPAMSAMLPERPSSGARPDRLVGASQRPDHFSSSKSETWF